MHDAEGELFRINGQRGPAHSRTAEHLYNNLTLESEIRVTDSSESIHPSCFVQKY